jgi:hypothetical protein
MPARIRSLTLACHISPAFKSFIHLICSHLNIGPRAHIWHPDCETKGRRLILGDQDMLGELINIPTDTLFDMLYVILGGGAVLTARDVTELEQIQRELQRRTDGSRAPYRYIN